METGGIVLIEDDAHQRSFFCLASRLAGLDRVEAYESARTGLAALVGKRPEEPAVVFLDLWLPDGSGLQVLEELRRNEGTRRVPVVMLTASDCGEDVEAAYAAGANSFLSKPVELEALKTAIRYWTRINRSSGGARLPLRRAG